VRTFHLSRNIGTILQLQRHISITGEFIVGGVVLRDGYSRIDVQSLRPRSVDRIEREHGIDQP
jgi:hypothetical protein